MRGPPRQTFAEIWERDARWLLGPGLLGDVIEHLRGRAPIIVPDDRDPSSATVTLPLPWVRDAVTGNLLSVYFAVPEELRPIFAERCSLVVRDWYGPEADRVMHQHALRMQNTAANHERINGMLQHIERERMARGEDAELWEIAANRFGFSRWSLPQPAGTTVV